MSVMQTSEEDVVIHADPALQTKLNEALSDATAPVEYEGPNLFQVLVRALSIAFSSQPAAKGKAKAAAAGSHDK